MSQFNRIIPIEHLQIIRDWIRKSEAIIINTGAGMGVDSGLADYRGTDGQWGQVENETGKSIYEIINPVAFIKNPSFSWCFFAERMKKFENGKPHQGFFILKNWIEKFNMDYFILTSNIDGYFQRAGFGLDKIREVHGSLSFLQSSRPDINPEIWPNNLSADEILRNARKGIFPICSVSGSIARPNIYMFRDDTYIDKRSKIQKKEFETFLKRNLDKEILVFEIGSGPHVQTIRAKTRMLKTQYGAKIIRINPKEYSIRDPHIGIACGALDALTQINNFL